MISRQPLPIFYILISAVFINRVLMLPIDFARRVRGSALYLVKIERSTRCFLCLQLKLTF